MKAKHILFYVILFALLFNYSQTICQTNPNFNFNNESMEGWSLNLINDYNQPIYNSFFVGPEWSDNTNYPNPILNDPTGDVNGSLSFSCVEGTGIEDTATFWIMQFVSPDLSSSPDWQIAKGYSVQLSDNMSQPGYSTTIWANLYVQVFDKDAGSIRYFYNGTAQPLTKGEWNYFSFDWSTIGTFPKNYTVQNIFVNIWGTISGYYAGVVYLDEVNLIPGGNITITSPNGGENWFVGNTYDIQWNAIGPVSVKLEYSTNNGVNWNTIAINEKAAAGIYRWTIPNTPSKNCLVRITDENVESGVYDISDGVFSINPPTTITVTTPNGGENWATGTQNYINWTSTDVQNVNLEYTTDEGQNWQLIISGVPASNSNYLWTIPNTPSTNCLVKISDAANSYNFDLSDGVFTISSKSAVTLSAPNGGENWIIGSTKEITWLSSPSIILVKIEYSTNGGNSWITINNNALASSGGYSWVIPNTPSTRCLVKISDVSDASTYDISDSYFSISLPPSVTVITPNGGEKWLAGNNYNITWTSNSIENVKIEFSTNNGSSWNNVALSVQAIAATYSWKIPDLPSDQCLVKISDAGNSNVFDISNSVFTISSPATITVNVPNGGENWQVGSLHDIIWTSNNVSNVKIEYSTNNGSNWINIAQSLSNADSYRWTLPNTPSANCRVRVSDASNAAVNDQSNSIFTISSPPSISVVSPDGGENWVVGTSHNIIWTSTSVSNVKIEYSTNSGSNWLTIISSTPSASSRIYPWLIPNTPSAQCLIRITDVLNTQTYDVSNNPFIINATIPQLEVTAPKGGDILLVGNSYDITWTSIDIANVKLEYSTDAGNNWINIISSIAANPGTFKWNVPNTPSPTCKIRISDAVNSEVSAESDIFTINQPLLLTSPNGGETWSSGTTHNITWESDNITNLKIEYSTDGGINWITIISNVSASTNSYSWSVPNTPSSQCLIRISDALNPSIFDQSDAVFTINTSVSLISVISPKSGDIWFVGNSYTIQWDQNIQEVINIELYKGNSLSMVIAAPVYAVNAPYGTYDWAVPLDLPGGNDYRIKIISSLNDSVFAFSDFFSIIHQGPAANFEASPVQGLRPLIVNFLDLSTGEVTSWQWNFGDGSTSNEQNPVHTYKEGGSFNVELTVTGSGGSNSFTRENYITVDSLRWNLPLNTKVGENVFISTTVPDYFKPTIHKLFYRMGGQAAFIETDFQTFNDSLDAVIPQDFITIRGIEYYILLSDGERTYTYPETDPQNHPAIISVSLQNVMPVVSFQSKKYDMISIPLNLAGNNVINFLINAYGQYDKNNWRLFRWDNSSSSYLEYPDLNIELTPGIAFWLITRNGNNFSISNAKSISTSKAFMINLNPGWNQIGNPFSFPVAWDSIQNSGLVQTPVYWNSEKQQYESSPILWNTETNKYEGNQKSLIPWRGYFVYNQTESEVILGVPPVESTGLDKNIGTYSFNKDEFIIQIKCYGKSNNNDYQNYVGMLNKAKEGTDKFDVFEPPEVSDKLNLTIIRDNKSFIQNIVPVSTEGAYWDIRIISNQPDKNIRIEFEKISSLPDNFKIWFLDKNRMLSIPVNDNGADIQLPENENGKFRLIVGKEEYANENSEQIPLVPLDYTLFQNYPNPFNSTTRIMYNLKEKSQVRVEVFDILGRRVKVLVDNDFQNPGTHNLVWDGKNTNGNYTASGVYIYRLNANDFSDSKIMVLLK